MAIESKGYGWPILGIVAIVAVVGLVMLFAQKTGTAEEAAAGEATISSKISETVMLEKLNKAVVLSFTENPELKSCSNFCFINKRTCVGAYLNIPEVVKQSDGTPLRMDHWIPIGCNEAEASNPVRCRCY